MTTPNDAKLDRTAQNTDRELWRDPPGDYYANSIHVTALGGIGINVSGTVIVKPLRQWHALAKANERLEAQLAIANRALTKIDAIRNDLVGYQGFNFSQHGYPLVAALEEAGIKGQSYEESRKNLGTVIEQRDQAREQRDKVATAAQRMARTHHDTCSSELIKGYACDCGRDEIQTTLAALEKEREA